MLAVGDEMEGMMESMNMPDDAALARKVIAAEKLVEAAKVAIDVMEFVDGENDCRRGVSALEEALAAWEAAQ